jgi:hypothetical protein
MRRGRLVATIAALAGCALLGSCKDSAEDGNGGADSDTDTDTDTDADADSDVPDPDPAAPFAAVELFTSES